MPPVTHNNDPTFAFEAENWEKCVPNQYRLTKVFRQSDQSKWFLLFESANLTNWLAFVDMLNEMRYGKLTQASITKFKQLSRALQFDDGIEPTEL